MHIKQNVFEIYMQSVGPNQAAVIELVRQLSALSYEEALARVESAPCVIKSAFSREEAERITSMLTEAGATVEIR